MSKSKNKTIACEPLGDIDKQRIASLILQVCQLCDGTMKKRIDDMLDPLLWSYNVDGIYQGELLKDGWLPAAGRLTDTHSERVPRTAAARQAIANPKCSTLVRREHVVPRKMLKQVIRKIDSVERLKAILDKYCIVALVTVDEMQLPEAGGQADAKSRRLAPQMPEDWGYDVNWTDTPIDKLPTAWRRYIDARIVLCQHGKQLYWHEASW